ncbi:hypothetical protein MASR1M97_14860 [Candidatus Desulfobacillus denitrificans]
MKKGKSSLLGLALQRRRWLLLGLLGLLHLLLLEGIASGVGRMLLVMHIGFSSSGNPSCAPSSA